MLYTRSVLGAAMVVGFGICTSPVAAQQAAPPSVAISGVIYSQYSYATNKDAAGANQNEFSVQRAYLNFIGKFGSDVLTRVTTDIAPSSTGSQTIRLKYAYAQYAPGSGALAYKMGLMHTPWVDWEENLYGYRMQGSIALDRNHYLTSSDFGAGIDGKWNSDQFNAQIAFVDGTGYSGGTGDNHKDIEGRASLRLMNTDDNGKSGGLRVTGYAGYGAPVGGGQRQRFVGMLSYKSKMLTLAGEFASTKDSSTAAPSPSATGQVISAYGIVNVPQSKVGILARVDLVDPNTSAAGDKTTRIIAGLAYTLTPNIKLLADVDALAYESGVVLTPAQEAAKTHALFQTQFTF